MSYDIRIKDAKFNITYNISPMLYMHNDDGIRVIYGLTGQEATVVLTNMYVYFINNKKKLENLNPINGWGSYEGMLGVLSKMIIASINNPTECWEGD